MQDCQSIRVVVMICATLVNTQTHRQIHGETDSRAISDGKRPIYVFEPPLGDLGATYDDHRRLIGKGVVDFLLVLIELLSLTRLTDGQTDGKTDKQTDRILIARPRLHSMQRGKN